MNKEQSAFNQLIEECAEISIIASKIKRFGLDSFSPLDPEQTTNRKLLIRELNDLMAAIEIINDRTDLDYSPDAKSIEMKKQKVQHFENISTEMGYVDQED